MKINKTLLAVDPFRYTVYQLFDYIKDKIKIELIQKDLGNLFFIKTNPDIDSLYNYVHVLNNDFESDDLETIKNFFGKTSFRIKAPADNIYTHSLLELGFKLKDYGYTMALKNLKNKDFNYLMPDGVRVVPVETSTALTDFKLIFSEAFNHQVSDYDKKFGFLEKFILDKNERHVNFFLIYENEVPVSSGGYYAFDKFSIENIGTAKAARGHGYASLMMRVLLQEAQKLNHDTACLVGSEEAVSIYQKLGFEILSKTKTLIYLN